MADPHAEEQEPAPDHTELVLRAVEAVPRGRVTTYGAIADHVGGGGPRRVARVLSRDGAGVCWWRCVRADGTLPAHLHEEALAAYVAEGTPLRPRRRDGSRPVDMAGAFWAHGVDGPAGD
ncbi:methylated-DNA-protein-cysteine methyltransferase-like protein [Nocardioides zeae]|uniref:Methylated-DNA-protein-cysteine methyltransferase-like protein n=2 Tax=Nocardioides zeae TaxID=1457234 RepID=A0AAJ1U3J4_9ACTN|nr:MGMT family protein [Nocardioides zeae]MDQ1103592.1 methylated-DNA-protein-cysteine methyltransferase-like protein [Nocardioides zeae]MDR6176686.1 methylated-DNA-protein-cysteine methyltransferase-like protein [Nocardioides zeae]MDR6209698.1 methylated-DNA-protein-cysteine methyltransferase-like protein [Nocardioides zeae]